MYEYLEKIAAKRQRNYAPAIGTGIGAAGMAGLAGGTAYGLPRAAGAIARRYADRRNVTQKGINWITRALPRVKEKYPAPRVPRVGRIITGAEGRRSSLYNSLAKRLKGDKKAKAAVLGAALLIGAGVGAGAGYLRSRNNH